MIEISEKEFLSGKHDTLIIDELNKDNLIIFPSESSYGFAGVAHSEKVHQKIHSTKKEECTKPIGTITNHPDKVEDLLHMGERGRVLLENIFASPLTILFKKKRDHPCTHNDYIGIRIPLNETTLKLCSFHDGPLTAPSANISGNPAIFSPLEIKKYFGKEDFVFINGGELQTRAPSTSYHFEENRTLRAGEISLDQIQKVLE